MTPHKHLLFMCLEVGTWCGNKEEGSEASRVGSRRLKLQIGWPSSSDDEGDI